MASSMVMTLAWVNTRSLFKVLTELGLPKTAVAMTTVAVLLVAAKVKQWYVVSTLSW